MCVRVVCLRAHAQRTVAAEAAGRDVGVDGEAVPPLVDDAGLRGGRDAALLTRARAVRMPVLRAELTHPVLDLHPCEKTGQLIMCDVHRTCADSW